MTSVVSSAADIWVVTAALKQITGNRKIASCLFVYQLRECEKGETTLFSKLCSKIEIRSTCCVKLFTQPNLNYC